MECSLTEDEKTIQELREEILVLRQQLDWFKRQLFGRKSEKRFIEDRPEQPLLDGLVTQASESAKAGVATATKCTLGPPVPPRAAGLHSPKARRR